MILLAAPLLAAHRLAPSLSDPGRFSLGRVMSLAPLGMAAALADGVIEFGYLSLLPAYATEAGASDSTALHLLAVLLIGGVTLQFFMGWLADRVDRVRLLATLGVLLSALCALLAVLVDAEGFAVLPASSVGGVAMAFYALGLTLLGEQVPADQLVLGNAGFFMAYAAGGVVGPLVGGAAMALWEPHGLAQVIASAGLALAAYAVASGYRRSKHQARGTARSTAAGAQPRAGSSRPPPPAQPGRYGRKHA
jgi:MFS family permease